MSDMGINLVAFPSSPPASTAAKPLRGGLPAWQQKRVAEFIETHLAEEISLTALAELVDLNLQELAQRRLLLSRDRIELNRGAENILRRRRAAPDLDDGSQHFARDVEAAVTRKNERARRSRLDRRPMHDRRPAHRKIRQFAVDLGQLNGDERRGDALGTTTITARGHDSL